MANIDVQFAIEATTVPDASTLKNWVNAALARENEHAEISLRIVDEIEIQQLNKHYRGKDKPTNVLSFPAEFPPELGLNLLGDIVICAEVVKREAAEQEKTIAAHWAHMVIHGALHLQGYDHIEDEEAERMEAHETEILAKLGFPAPYLNT